MASEKIDALELDITSKTSTENVDKLIDSLSRLSTELGKIKSKKVSVDIKQTGDASKSAATSVNKLSGSFLTQAIRITAVIALFRKLSGVIADGVANSATYIKSLNMFTVSLGNYADNATKYGETVSQALGIDIAGWQKTQGIFQTLITGFGVTGDKAAYMSQNITQLSYDIASFYGITNEEAANKLKSALSGRLEPIRKLGYDLSQSKLVDIGQNPANYGKQKFYIDEETGAIKANTVATDDNTKHKIVNFNQLTQQEKVQLRYIALMTQVTQVQGNYARALNDPANQLNVFKEQLNMTSRALGNMFIPFLNKALPYLTAFAQLAQQAFQSIANLFGFKLPDMKDRTDISKNVAPYNKVVKATGDAAKNAKKMKDYMLGIDELNVFNPNTGAGAGGGSNKGQNSNLKNLKLPGYDFLSKAVENSIKKAKETLKKLADDFKKDPLLFTARIVVEGMANLGAKIWEWLLGMSPEQLKAEAKKHGRSIGEEFWEQFKAGVSAKLGSVGASIWSLILGKSPDELKADARTHGTDIGTEFINRLADRIDGQVVWEALWGTPTEFAKKAQEAGQTVGEYFTTGLTTMLLKWSKTNPIFSAMYKMFTGTDLDTVIAAYEAKLNPKKQGSTAPRGYVSYYQAKSLSEAQNKQTKAAEAKKTGGIPAVDNSMNLANAKKAANDFIDAYNTELTSQKGKVQYSATQGIFNPSIKGITNNGNGNSKFKYVSADEAKSYYSNFNSKGTKDKTYKAAATMAQSGANGADSKTSAFTNAGINNTAGYIKGIRALLKEVGEAGADIGAKAIAAAKKKTKTASPSKAFAEIGMFSALGYAKGVEDNSNSVTDAVSVMADKALATMRKASNMSNSLIASGSYSMPATNAGYGIGSANTDAMASLAGSIYQAVVSGMSSVGSESNGDIKVIIDGKEVFKAVQTESRKRGVAISNGAFSR